MGVGFRRDHFVRQLEVLALRLLGRRQHGLVGSRSAEVGREVGPRVSATCRYGLARAKALVINMAWNDW